MDGMHNSTINMCLEQGGGGGGGKEIKKVERKDLKNNSQLDENKTLLRNRAEVIFL